MTTLPELPELLELTLLTDLPTGRQLPQSVLDLVRDTCREQAILTRMEIVEWMEDQALLAHDVTDSYGRRVVKLPGESDQHDKNHCRADSVLRRVRP